MVSSFPLQLPLIFPVRVPKPMTSEKAYWLSRERKSDPVDVHVAESVIHELEEHLSRLPPTVSPLLSKRDIVV